MVLVDAVRLSHMPFQASPSPLQAHCAGWYSGAPSGGAGGLGWKNNISAAPGDSFRVVVGAGGDGAPATYGGGGGGAGGAVRVVWGPGRAFPSSLVNASSFIAFETVI